MTSASQATIPSTRVSGAGPTAILVHGTAPDLFDALEAELASAFSVVRLHRRGFEGSGLPAVRSLSPHAEDIAAIASARGDRALLVGWSIGAVIALEVALRFPDRVSALVLVEPPWLAVKHPSLPMLAAVLGAKLRGAFGRHAAAGERFLRWALRRRAGSHDLDALPASYLASVHANGRAILNELDGGTGEHLDAMLRAPLPIPVMLVTGSDSALEFGAATKRLAARLQVEPTSIQGAGHALQETHAHELATLIRSQLAT